MLSRVSKRQISTRRENWTDRMKGVNCGNSHGNLFVDICSPVLHLRVPRRKYRGRVEKIHWLLHWHQMESQSFKTFFKIQLLSTSRLYTKLTCDLRFSLSYSLDSVHTVRREYSKVLTCHWCTGEWKSWHQGGCWCQEREMSPTIQKWFMPIKTTANFL